MNDQSTLTEATEHTFQAHVSEVLSLVINSLYSNKEIFLRELLSNASDALDKQRFAMVSQAGEAGQGEEDRLRIRISFDRDAGTLTIDDNGIGMTADELVKNLGTIAHSGSKEFLAKLQDKQDLSLIGQFGVGFYSAYLVADRVEVVSRVAGAGQAYRWESNAKTTFTVGPGERDRRGSAVILHLKQDQLEYASSWRLRELVRRYSDYIGYPIELLETRETGEGDDKKTETTWEPINQARALWQRPAREITDEQYEEFYKHLTHEWDGPLCRKHFQIEGALLFTGLLFVPRRRPFDLFTTEQKHGVRLHVKRVFIMDDCEELLPRWLRFVRGVIDSDDLPLNVSREILQDSDVVRTIRKQVVKHCLDMLDALAKDDADGYATFWDNFGVVLKEGLHYEPQHKERLAKLLRYGSSKQAGLVSLDEYVDRMPEGQPAIYYSLGTSRAVLEASPHLEAIKKQGYEVLFMTDPIDQWAVSALSEYREKPLVSATTADLKLDAKDEAKDKDEAASAELKPLCTHMRAVLQDKVEKVQVSERLTDSPVCLVVPEGGLQPHIERLLRVQNADLPKTKRIMEVNPNHPLVHSLRELYSRDSDNGDVREWIELLYEQALLAEGSPVENPVTLATRLTKLLQSAAGAAAGK